MIATAISLEFAAPNDAVMLGGGGEDGGEVAEGPVGEAKRLSGQGRLEEAERLVARGRSAPPATRIGQKRRKEIRAENSHF